MEKYFHFDREKTLEELQGEDWGKSNFNSNLVFTCYKLSKKPIANFSAEDLRILIGQAIGLEYLMPLALEVLEDNVYSQGNYYCGDLLDVVLKVSNDFWLVNPMYKKDLEHIIEQNIRGLESKLNYFRQKFL